MENLSQTQNSHLTAKEETAFSFPARILLEKEFTGRWMFWTWVVDWD